VTLTNADSGEILYFNNTFSELMEIYLYIDTDGNVLWNATEYEEDDYEDEEMGDTESGGSSGETDETPLFDPEKDDEEWPGQFPEAGDGANQIIINVRYDR